MMSDYVLVWSDRIGITQVEFVHSEVFNAKSRVPNHVKEEDRRLTSRMRVVAITAKLITTGRNASGYALLLSQGHGWMSNPRYANTNDSEVC
jgi:hypothetical protein